MKTIATFPDLTSADIARSALEAEGIPAEVPDAHLAGLDWRLGTALGGVRLQVPPEHAEAAAAVLARHAVVDPEQVPSEPDSDEGCPSCKSIRIVSDRYRKVMVLSILFFPLLLIAIPLWLMSYGRYRCSECGFIWKQRGRTVG